MYEMWCRVIFHSFRGFFSCPLMVLQPVGEGWPLPPSPVHSLPLPRQIVSQVRLQLQNQKQIKYMLYEAVSCFHIETGYGKSLNFLQDMGHYHSVRISIQYSRVMRYQRQRWKNCWGECEDELWKSYCGSVKFYSGFWLYNKPRPNK